MKLKNLAILLSFFVILVTAACNQDEQKPILSTMENDVQPNSTFCPQAATGGPLFNVTGELTAGVEEGSEIFLYPIKDADLDSILAIIRECPPLQQTLIKDSYYFYFDNLPPGRYAPMVPITSFISGQGFPIVDEKQYLNYSLELIYHGGNPRYSLGPFVIQPLLNASS
ncbi:MAG: hypothetical protein K9K33_18805 [Desulfarculaceae bacterium]|nr:hypothetical protein [Desulfarculaceae bacterium]